MSSHTAIKFNPDLDESKPKIGDTDTYQGKFIKIMEVDWIQAGDLLKLLLENKSGDRKGYDEVLYTNHPDRPYVIWIRYVNYIDDIKL